MVALLGRKKLLGKSATCNDAVGRATPVVGSVLVGPTDIKEEMRNWVSLSLLMGVTTI